ncbi:conjugative transfer protein MobI(A/C) [Thioalkalivibrio sp. ALE16]|uniref:conjugative transfer protein MobI(A/C) n=1 Tax=Thioalkalivibrio sp. ALE16 TaxID=1158172 RepID=UPI00037932E0|nr:conjugative transfer protein MobI(A/C) [Thioalkalivibrio sp. ALE16]
MEEDLLGKMGAQKIRQVGETLEEWHEDLERQALEIKKEFDEEMYASRNGAPKEWFRYSVRVRSPKEERDRGMKQPATRLAIEWRRMEWVSTANGKKKYQARYVRKGSASRYATGRFKPASERERRMIESAEDRFAIVRDQVATIGSLRKVIANVTRAQKNKEELE